MKIRNLQEYIARRCDKPVSEITSALHMLGTDEEPFLFQILGADADIRTMVRDCANVAKNAELQVFYEFVQNAFDADADTVFFFMGKVDGNDYLLVLNNGRPFFTEDPKLHKDKKKKGQLLEFLNRSKSRKNIKEDLGRFGQGSKLLYTLLVDCNDHRDTASMMASAIIDDKRAPYLLSWSDGAQLDNFRMDRKMWDRTCGYDNLELIVAKLMCCYYPIEPGVNEDLFSNEETSILARVFNELVNPERNHIKLEEQGTAIILPLGKGKADLIRQERNMGKVQTCLAPFSEIIAGYKKFAGKRLKNIQFLGKDIPVIKADRVVVEVEKESMEHPGEMERFQYQFVFNQTFENEKCVNLYNVMPISDTTFNLGFIIDSLDFPVDGSRQGISDEDVAINNIRQAMRHFVEKMDELKTSNAATFDRIYSSLIKSRPTHRIVKTPYDEVIVPYLMKNVRCNDGSYNPIAATRYLNSTVSVPLAEVGVENFSLVSKDDCELLSELFCPINVKIEKITLSELLCSADEEKLKKWILKLDVEDYENFQNEVVASLGSSSSVKSIPVFRTNKGNVYRYNDVISASVCVFTKDYAREAFDVWSEAECVLCPLGSFAPSKSAMWGKLNVMQDLFYASASGRDFACRMLASIYNSLSNKSEVRKNFRIFTNLLDQRVALNDIVIEKNIESALYDRFTIKGMVPASVQQEWFVQASERWEWLNRNMETVKALDDWRVKVNNYLQDIEAINNRPMNAYIQLFLNEDGVPMKEDSYHYLNVPTKNLTMEEYKRLVGLFGDYNFVPYRFRERLSHAPFSLPKLELKDAVGTSITVNLQDLALLYKVKGKNLLNDYKIQTDSDHYCMCPLSSGERNYFYKNGNLDTVVEQQLLTAKFHRVPNELASIFVESTCITAEPSVVISAIHSCKNCLELIPLVEQCGVNVIKEFYSTIKQVDFSSSEKQLTEDDCRWNVIEWTANKQPAYKDTLWEKITMNGSALPSNLPPNKVVVMKDTDTVSKEYEVFLLVPELVENDERFHALQSLLPKPEFFEQEYCSARRSSMTVSQVISKLNMSSLNLYQTEFVLDAVLNEGCSVNPMVSFDKSVALGTVLDIVYSRGFVGFYKYLCIPDFNIKQQSFADPRLLLESERLPEELYDWIVCMSAEKKNDVLSLFGEGKLNHNHTLLNFRQHMLLNKKIVISRELKKEDATLLENTYKWIECKQESGEISLSGDVSVGNFQLLQEKLWRGAPVHLLRLKGVNSNSEMCYSLAETSATALKFLCMKGYEVHICKMLSNPASRLNELICTNTVCLPLRSEELLNKHSLGNIVRWQVRNESKHSEEWSEWGNLIYQRWCGTDESKGIHIYRCSHPIQKTLSIIDEQGALLCEDTLGINDRYGYADGQKSVAVVAVSDREILKVLEEATQETDMTFFRSPFIALQGMMLNDLQDKLMNTGQNQDQDLGASKDELSDGVRIPTKRAELIKDVPDEMLQMLKEGKLGLFENGAGGYGRGSLKEIDDKDELPENKISGYIGELLYNEYLERKGITHEWSAEIPVKEYDFNVMAGDSYVDVKTNVNTLVNGDVPLYIHKSQHIFLKENTNSRYYFCRLSLMDLGIRSEYMPIRKQYENQDPRVCPELKEACIRLVNEFWNKPSSMETFEATRHIYRVKIESWRS